MKVVVSKNFSKTPHGEIGCEGCHGGNPAASDKTAAHLERDPYPSITDPHKACGGCHEKITASASRSLHAGLAPYKTALKNRADMTRWDLIDHARQRHCGECHTGCGACHVSRPKSTRGGFINGHLFNKRPDVINQCSACHGSRVGNEFFGKRGQGDVHALKYNMDCMDCHRAEEMHAMAPEGIKGRYYLPEKVACIDCHQDLAYGSVRDHTIHLGKVQCQVCHSQTYVNCYNCHTGTDSEGLVYRVNRKNEENMKIGRNYDKTAPGAAYDYMLVRHVPVNPKLFDFYVKDAFPHFDRQPTWKRTSPHNIQRKTWQAASCNHCHGERSLFLAPKDLDTGEIAANQAVVVSDTQVPPSIKKTRQQHVDTSQVKSDRVVNTTWLHNHMGRKKLVLVDARPLVDYNKGHIPGAIHFDALSARNGLRWPWGSAHPAHLKDTDTIARILGENGMGTDNLIVVYGQDGWRAGFLLSVLEYAGAPRFSILTGGFQAWREAGYPISETAFQGAPKTFTVNAQARFLVDNAYVQKSLDNPGVLIVDVRSLDHSNLLTMHDQAIRPGRIPGSLKVPFTTFFMDNSGLKPPAELLFVLKTRGITPDKTVVLTSETGARAGSVFFILRYLGYPDVRVHQASWVGWCRQNCTFDD